ncbi:MAG: PD-(D/E)XK nuclease family protein, partial [Deltaproteobacteria bacterium]|nr:PD-(D/E)XK nuclease family protein [Deltaproteobacteria bacterium]
MRNVFDQYASPENRLTHALACALTEDRRLLRRFLREVAKSTPPEFRTAQILEQSFPGEPELAEDEAEQAGLPDMWIHDGEDWSVLVESKIAAKVSTDQLNRHLRTAQRRGFSNTLLLVIIASNARKKMPPGCVEIRWPTIYRWALRHSRKSEWARRLFEYMEVAERRMTEDGYLKEGALTEFNGIPFGEDRPYNYTEAKRILRLATTALRSKKGLQKNALADLDAPGRPAITGKHGCAVWDYIPITRALKDKPFNWSPHLTLGIEKERALITLTVPSGLDPHMRKNLITL